MTATLSCSENQPTLVAEPRYEAADLLIHYLEQLRVEYIFGVPGGAIEPLYNALARSERRGGVRSIVARHEAGAAYMAEGYWRETGRLGVCCTTTGPGATNAVTGIASAFMDRVPLLLITAQTPLRSMGRGAFQDSSDAGGGINTVAMLAHCTRYSSLVAHPGQMEDKIAQAIFAAWRHPRGPVHLSVPLDVFRTPWPSRAPKYNLAPLLQPTWYVDEIALQALRTRLSQARKTVIYLGESCGEAIGSILEFALMTQATLVAAPQAKGLISSYHPRFAGIFGFAGHASARQALLDPEVDVILAVGAGLDEYNTNGWDPVLLNSRLIHIDEDPTNFARSPMAALHVYGRLLTVFQALIHHSPPADALLLETESLRQVERRREERRHGDVLPPGAAFVPRLVVDRRDERRASTESSSSLPARRFTLDSEEKYVDNSTPIKPQRLMYDLARLCPPDTRFFADSGNAVLWAIHSLHPLDRRVGGRRDVRLGTVGTALGLAGMGKGIGNAIGVALGSRQQPMVCITGDGSMLMNGQEITVAMSQKLTVVFVILNDQALGTVKHGQRLGDGESIGHELPAINYADLAKAMGIPGHVIKSPQDIAAISMRSICKHQGPTLLDIRIDGEETPPLEKLCPDGRGKN